ncbi:hypothetical protein B0H13DRAFT_2032903 [Mycena leptocephala]|nr:hypothetical protein B0H13DRAFT_2032903 [Mycena leptocephala]
MLRMSTLSSAKLTCKLCRQRKIRCDGENPCGPCSRARKPSTCEYIDPSRAELPKGAACIPCCFQKCDGCRPCLTCKNSSQPDKCQYRDQDPDYTSNETSDSLAVSAPAEPETLEDVSSQVDPSLAERFLQAEPISNMTVSNAARPAQSQSSYMPTIFAAPNASISLESEVDQATELSSIRSLFLNHCWQYGLIISPEKRAAIARGDTSGAIVHSVLISACQLFGYLLASQMDAAGDPDSEGYAYLRGHWIERETAQRTRVLTLLDTAVDTDTNPGAPDPLTCVQVYKLLAVYSAQRHNMRGFEEFLGNASNIALRHHIALGLDDLESRSWAADEGRSALAHLVYLEVACGIILKNPPRLPPVILAKFRRLATMNLEENELNFLRAKGALLLAQSQQLTAEWNRSEPGSMVGSEWGEQWIKVTGCTQTQLGVINTALPDRSLSHKVQFLILKSCMIVALAAMAELYAVFAPFHARARRKHSMIINAIAGISRTLSPTDHKYFDCMSEICWGVASREISEPSEATPQWRVCLANAVLPDNPGDNEPLSLVRDQGEHDYQDIRNIAGALKCL